MKNQSGDSPRLVVLKLDNGEFAEDVSHHEATPGRTPVSGNPSTAKDRDAALEIVGSHGLADQLVEGDPSAMSPGTLSRRAHHPSTDDRYQEPQIEEEI